MDSIFNVVNWACPGYDFEVVNVVCWQGTLLSFSTVCIKFKIEVSVSKLEVNWCHRCPRIYHRILPSHLPHPIREGDNRWIGSCCYWGFGWASGMSWSIFSALVIILKKGSDSFLGKWGVCAHSSLKVRLYKVHFDSTILVICIQSPRLTHIVT